MLLSFTTAITFFPSNVDRWFRYLIAAHVVGVSDEGSLGHPPPHGQHLCVHALGVGGEHLVVGVERLRAGRGRGRGRRRLRGRHLVELGLILSEDGPLDATHVRLKDNNTMRSGQARVGRGHLSVHYTMIRFYQSFGGI